MGNLWGCMIEYDGLGHGGRVWRWHAGSPRRHRSKVGGSLDAFFARRLNALTGFNGFGSKVSAVDFVDGKCDGTCVSETSTLEETLLHETPMIYKEFPLEISTRRRKLKDTLERGKN